MFNTKINLMILKKSSIENFTNKYLSRLLNISFYFIIFEPSAPLLNHKSNRLSKIFVAHLIYSIMHIFNIPWSNYRMSVRLRFRFYGRVLREAKSSWNEMSINIMRSRSLDCGGFAIGPEEDRCLKDKFYIFTHAF